jgi:RNA-binding protein
MMAIDAKRRRELAAQGNRLEARLTIGAAADALPDSVVAHVRRALEAAELLKIRVQADDRDACAAVGQQLVERVPCELVQRVGRVLLVYRERSSGAEMSDK